MEPVTSDEGLGRVVLFWGLFVLGTAVLVFAVLLAQIPGDDRTFEVIMLSIAGILVLAALVLARLRAALHGGWRLWPFALVVLGGELLTCLDGLISELAYRHR
jgi:hypothetical protein